jgi:hypothetical protein
MRKLLKTLAIGITLLLAATFAGALPPAFTAKGNPGLYKDLRAKAESNLKHMDGSHKKQYKKLLKAHPDVLMAFLIAYESDAVLTCADPADVESNYLQVKELLESKGTGHSPEFYLSYVARQTVSDERIQAYRQALLDDGLRELLDGDTDEVDLYRKVSMWCVEKLKFKPTSGRDQSPLDITQRSLLGRCEEMQILFVAAARTVGLPARPASTPWWPHTDNNHAWAEVWLEDAWHYTGDMDAAYYPDQTWFSGMIDKTVLILADGTIPSERDEVLVRGERDCVINSIRNYAGERTRRLKLLITDERGDPVPEAAVGVMVYNWGTLRSLVFLQSDAQGRLEFSVGRGAFYLSAYKDGKQALQAIPSGEDTELDYSLILREGPLPEQDEMLAYPANPFEWKQAPPAWNDGVKLAKEKWSAQDKAWSDHAATYRDSLLGAMVAACRGNYPEFEKFLGRLGQADGEFISWMLSEDPQYMDPKFLWQATAEQFLALFYQFQAFEHMFEYEDLASVIAPTVFFEELPQPFPLAKGVSSLFPKQFYGKGKGEIRQEKLCSALTWLKKNYRIDAKRALQGLIPLHVAAKQKYLTPYQYRILAVNLARANAIPAEFTRQPDLIYVQYDNGDWGYFDLMKCAPEADVKDGSAFTRVKVLASDEAGAPVSGMQSGVQLCRYQEGSFYWLDSSFKEEGTGCYAISVPRGKYYLNSGYRISDSKTAFQLKYLDLSDTDSLALELTLRDYPRAWNKEVPPAILDLLAGEDTADYDAVLIGNHDRENSLRLAEKLRAAGVGFLWLGYEPAPLELAEYRVSPAWQALVGADERNRVRTVTLYRKDGAWQSFEGLWDKLPE